MKAARNSNILSDQTKGSPTPKEESLPITSPVIPESISAKSLGIEVNEVSVESLKFIKKRLEEIQNNFRDIGLDAISRYAINRAHKEAEESIEVLESIYSSIDSATEEALADGIKNIKDKIEIYQEIITQFNESKKEGVKEEASETKKLEPLVLAPEQRVDVEAESPKEVVKLKVDTEPNQIEINEEKHKLLKELVSFEADVDNSLYSDSETKVDEQRAILKERVETLKQEIHNLNSAKEKEVFKLWEKLDYLYKYFERIQSIEGGSFEDGREVIAENAEEEIAPVEIEPNPVPNTENLPKPDEAPKFSKFVPSPAKPPEKEVITNKNETELPFQEFEGEKRMAAIDRRNAEIEDVAEIASAAENLILYEERNNKFPSEWSRGAFLGLGRPLSEMRIDEFMANKSQYRPWLNNLLERGGEFAQKPNQVPPNMRMNEYIHKVYQGIIKAQQHAAKTGNEGTRARLLGI
jgi:hypothetical protein